MSANLKRTHRCNRIFPLHKPLRKREGAEVIPSVRRPAKITDNETKVKFRSNEFHTHFAETFLFFQRVIPMTTENEITLKLHTVSFPDEVNPLLKDINLTVNKGDFIILTGEPGSGKSMLLHTITGAAEKYHGAEVNGTVTLRGIDRKTIPLPQICKYIGCMFQEPANQIVGMTVKEEVSFGTANICCTKKEIARRSKEALNYVGLTGMEQRSTQNLSGGEAQRLALASILALKAPILLLDQPGAELDPKGKAELYRHIHRLNREQKITVLLIPDENIDFSAMANRRWEISNSTVNELPVQLQKRESPFPAPDYTHCRSGETVLAMNHVSYRYPADTEGCTDISLEVNAGEFIALTGENGAGKSTILKLAEGLLKPQAGTITVFGETYQKKNTAALRRKIGFLFQNPDLQLFSDSVEAELAFGLKNTGLAPDEKEKRISDLLQDLGLTEFRNLHPQRLSRSASQKLALGTALIHQPKLIIADEPTAGLNGNDSEELMTLLSKQCKKGNAVLLVTHDLELARKYAQRLIRIKNHRLQADTDKAVSAFQEDFSVQEVDYHQKLE